MGYTVFGCTSTRFFEEWEKAEAFAVEEAKQGAEKEARKRGAAEDITITCSVNRLEAPASLCMVDLGATVEAKAVGGSQF